MQENSVFSMRKPVDNSLYCPWSNLTTTIKAPH